MKKYLLFGALFMATGTFAQITVTENDLIQVSDVVEQAYDQSTTINHTSGGTDLTWNYDQLVEDSAGVLNVGKPSWATGGANFPNANLYGDNNSGQGNVFFRKDASALDLLGLYGDITGNGNDQAVYFASQNRVTPLPLTYGTTDQNSYVLDFTFEPGQQFDSIRVKQEADQDFEADAWGELTTPLGTFDAIRLMKKEVSVDSVWGYVGGFEQLLEDSKDSTYTYSFFTDDSSVRYTLLEYDFNPMTQQVEGDIMWLKAKPTTSLTENSKEKFTLYPNPATNEVTVSTQAEQARIEILDMKGTVVKRSNKDQLVHTIDVSRLEKGIYFVKVYSNEQQTGTKKFMKQ